MSEIYRCANCGNQIRHPRQSCRMCGYKPEQEEAQRENFRVILTQAGPNKSEVIDYLVVLLGQPKETVRKAILKPPTVIYEGSSEAKAEEIIDKMRMLGAESIIDHQQVMGTTPQEPLKHLPANSGGCLQRFVWVIVIILAIGMQMYKGYRKQIDDVLEKFGVKSLYSEIDNEFDEVEIVVARNNIHKGEIITWDKIKKMKISRKEVPSGALSPIHVDAIIGKPSSQVFPLGSILVIPLESMPDNK